MKKKPPAPCNEARAASAFGRVRERGEEGSRL
jgi:hypothetical protein